MDDVLRCLSVYLCVYQHDSRTAVDAGRSVGCGDAGVMNDEALHVAHLHQLVAPGLYVRQQHTS